MRKVIVICLLACLFTTQGCNKSKPVELSYTKDGLTYGVTENVDVYSPITSEETDNFVNVETASWASGSIFINDTEIKNELTIDQFLNAGYISIEEIKNNITTVNLSKENDRLTITLKEIEGLPVEKFPVRQILIFGEGCSIIKEIPRNSTKEDILKLYGKPSYKTNYTATSQTFTYKTEDSKYILEIYFDEQEVVNGMGLYLPERLDQ